MGDDHVAERARLLIEGGPSFQIELLGYVDLNRRDIPAVPDRLEQTIGEAQREDVLRRLLAQEVIDAKDLLLLCVAVQHGVQLDRGREV